jgi:hypothetical protein
VCALSLRPAGGDRGKADEARRRQGANGVRPTAIPEQEAPGHRLGGSPEVGTSDMGAASSAGPMRRDGGPEKGTRGPAPGSGR